MEMFKCFYISSRYTPPNPLVIDKRIYPTQMSPDERSKHAYYVQRNLDEVCCHVIVIIYYADREH